METKTTVKELKSKYQMRFKASSISTSQEEKKTSSGSSLINKTSDALLKLWSKNCFIPADAWIEFTRANERIYFF